MKKMIYGYCRISTAKQSIERQITNISKEYPTAVIRQEVYTGTKSNRPEWQKLMRTIKKGDTIIFDSVSRMSRNAEEGFATYMELYNKGINLVFLKESTVNTDTFKSVLGDTKLNTTVSTNDSDTDKLVNDIMSAVSSYITRLAEKQIQLAFEQSEKEVSDLRQRTSEGLREARANGKRIGNVCGSKFTTTKSIDSKLAILNRAKAFGGIYPDKDLIRLLNIRSNTYYKYKAELKAELKYNHISDIESHLKDEKEKRIHKEPKPLLLK